MGMNLSYNIGLLQFWLIVGVFYLAIAAILFLKKIIFIKKSKKTTGVIINYKTEYESRNYGNRSNSFPLYRPTVQFVVDNKTHEFTSSFMSSKFKNAEGSKIDILYNPENPNEAILDHSFAKKSGYILGFVSFLFILFRIYLAIQSTTEPALVTEQSEIMHFYIPKIIDLAIAITGYFAIRSFVKRNKFLKTAQKATGEIIRVESQVISKSNVPVVSYQDTNGMSHQLKGLIGSNPPPVIGTEMSVIYQQKPGKPIKAYFYKFSSFWLLTVILFGLGSSCSYYSLQRQNDYDRSISWKPDQSALLVNGKIVYREPSSRFSDPTLTSNNIIWYDLVVEVVHPNLNKTYRFESHIHRWKSGEPFPYTSLEVYVHPKKPYFKIKDAKKLFWEDEE